LASPEQGEYPSNGPPCASQARGEPLGRYANVACAATGRYVTLQQTGSLDTKIPGVMNICQIRVFGDALEAPSRARRLLVDRLGRRHVRTALSLGSFVVGCVALLLLKWALSALRRRTTTSSSRSGALMHHLSALWPLRVHTQRTD
jgi:hypothetical protein